MQFRLPCYCRTYIIYCQSCLIFSVAQCMFPIKVTHFCKLIKQYSMQMTCLQWASGTSPAQHSHCASRTIPLWHTMTSTLYVIDLFISAKHRAGTSTDCPGHCSRAKQESFFVQFLVKLHQVCVNCILFNTCNWNLQKK